MTEEQQEEFDRQVTELLEEVKRTGHAGLTRFLPTGEVRGIWVDSFDARVAFAVRPHRASRIEVIEEGEHAGQFYVDFSPLADLSGNEEFRQRFEPFKGYNEARRFEILWLLKNWVLASR